MPPSPPPSAPSSTETSIDSAPAPRHFVVATAGHVDHGKSALVRALTGTDPDRLPEEKARGITIDLGFARLLLPGLELGIVDVPGHEDFVKNMVAGVGSVDAALFVVAADDGWMPQTEEHLEILSHLGVTRAVVVLTKIDLAQDEARSTALVRARLRGSPFAHAPIVPTSVVNRRGVDELRTTLGQVLAAAPPPRDVGKPRLPVDRVFILKGVGTVVTGTLTGGALLRGQAVAAYPSCHGAHIRSVQNHGRDAPCAVPGTRTAVNLPDGAGAVVRGEVLTLPELGSSSPVLDVLLIRSRREASWLDKKGSPRLRDGTNVRVHLGSGSRNAEVRLLDGGELLAGARTIARLRCDHGVFAFPGDRFIVRDGMGRHTLAGGVVLDATAEAQRRFRSGPQRRLLERLAGVWTGRVVAEPGFSSDAPPADEAPGAEAEHRKSRLRQHILALLERDQAEFRESLLRRAPYSSMEIELAVTELAVEKQLFVTDEVVMDGGWWREVCRKAAARVDAAHRDHPEQIGLALKQLPPTSERFFHLAGLSACLVHALTRPGGFVQVGAFIRRASHRPTLPPHLQAAGCRLRAALTAKPFEPPSRQELAPDGVSRQALRFLFDTGEALALGTDLVLLEESFRRMQTIIVRSIRAGGPATTSDLRQILGTTRRVLVPLLEHLDREGVTRREGDRRALR